MAWPPLPASDTGLDYRAAALRVVRKHCGWHIAPVIEDTLTLDGSGGRALLVPSNRVVEVLSVREDGAEVDLGGVEVSKTGVLRKKRGRWTDALGGVEVVLRHGHEDFDDIEGVVTAVAARAAATGTGALSETAGPFSIRRGTTGGGGEVVGLPLLVTEKAVLEPYRLTWGV